MKNNKIKTIILSVTAVIIAAALTLGISGCKKKTQAEVSAAESQIQKDDNYVVDPFADDGEATTAAGDTTAASGSGSSSATTKKASSGSSSGSSSSSGSKTTTTKKNSATTTKKASQTTTKANINTENTDETGGKWTGYY